MHRLCEDSFELILKYTFLLHSGKHLTKCFMLGKLESPDPWVETPSLTFINTLTWDTVEQFG